MSKKKVQKVTVSQADEAQAQEVLEQFHTLAGELRSSKNQQEAEAALSTITGLPEAAQVALLLALSKERHSDAADVLIAINQLSPEKSIRKEARRSLIRLEEARIYPQWEPPVERTSPFEAIRSAMNMEEAGNPPRFWKGILSDTRDSGQVQLMLMWEQGKDYKDVRILGFLLEFWHDGVKDFYTRIESKRIADSLIEQIKTEEETLDCSLAKGRRLIEEALTVNKKHGTPTHKDFRLSISLINKLVLENPDIVEEELEEFEEDEEDEEAVEIDPDLPPVQVVTSFVEAWVDEDYPMAYNLLADGSRLREGLTEEEWVERREEWAEDARPDYLRPGFVKERQARKSGIWLPSTFSRNAAQTYKEIDAGWSIVLEDTAEKDILPELPQETVLYEETGRHWFWVCFKLVEEPGGWRIDDMVDEGKNAQSIPAAELRKRIEQHNQEIQKITKKHPSTDPDALEYVDEVLFHIMEVTNYDDALIAKDPLDKKAYLDAVSRAALFGDHERSIVYLEGIARYYPEEQAEAWRQIGSHQLKVSEKYYEEDDVVRGERLLVLAEEILRKSLTMEDSVNALLTLADVLHDMGGDDKLEEAELELRKAQAMTKDEKLLEDIESELGHMAMDRKMYEASLSHYQRLVTMNPSYPNARYNIGRAYQKLEYTQEAIANFKQAIEIEPDNLNAYADLSTAYVNENQVSMARRVLEDGAAANPDTVDLQLLLVSNYIESKDYVRAEEWMKKAESIDPDDETVQMFRQILTISKLQPAFHSNIKKFRKR